jgi:hypothetical protein
VLVFFGPRWGGFLPPIAIAITAPTAATAATTATATAESAATTAAESAAATAATAAATAATTFGVGLGPGLIDNDLTTLQVLAVQCFHGFLAVTARSHFHETEPFGFAGLAIRDDLGTDNLAVRFKKIGQFVFSQGEGKIAHIKLHDPFPPHKWL